MNYEVKYVKVPSTDKKHLLNCKVYIPEGEVKGKLQVVHGMTEYIERYDGFMSFLASNGYICFAHDHLGHGHTAENEDELGYIAHENGYALLVDDVKAVGDFFDNEFGGTHALFGHSMGSFVVRLFAAKYRGSTEKLIIMGTGGPEPAAAGLFAVDLIKLFRGERHRSKLLYSLAFGAYNKRFKNEHDVRSWLSRDRAIRDKYREDKFCNYLFTACAMHDLLKLTAGANSKQTFRSTPKNLPILIVSGDSDPVGKNGKGVKKVFNGYKKAGSENVEMKLYPNARHEILNDLCKREVYDDILTFLSGNT